MELCWKTKGAALGAPVLEAFDDNTRDTRVPRSHKSSVKEFVSFHVGLQLQSPGVLHHPEQMHCDDNCLIIETVFVD